MASTLKKNSAVDDAKYNNFIKDFANYYKRYQKCVKKIVEEDIAKTVMVQDVWTNQYASDYAIWFNDQEGVSDGCDKLNRTMIELEALFKTTCFAPIKDVVKLLGEDTLSDPNFGMIQKVYKAKTVYDAIGVTKYHKKNFTVLKLKRLKGWKATANAQRINKMVSDIEKDVNTLKSLSVQIQKLIQKAVITPGERCIEIAGFTGQDLTKTMKNVTTKLDRFSDVSKKKAEAAIEALNVTQDSLNTNLSTVVEEE